ncbi:MAG: hypothetical protein CM15mP93_09730 [Thiotrichaceae bacterium]|nr:MAG: hypothetical protein CM15mP93_09730 [Thiotrichaceae bacterium]
MLFLLFITLIIVNLSGNHKKLIYFILGILLWYFFKIRNSCNNWGVLLAATIPNVMNSNWKSMLKELEHSLHNFVGLFILPVFAFF